MTYCTLGLGMAVDRQNIFLKKRRTPRKKANSLDLRPQCQDREIHSESLRMEVSQPVLLARLPRSPLEDGRIRTGQVYGVRAGQKRKRSEICTAVDGESLNLYEVIDD